VRQRVQLTVSCRDADAVPKVPNAGQVVEIPDGRVQIMHDGSRVMAGGYHGDWMIEVIRSLRGHHEPQEELLFHHLLGYVRPGTLVVELGCFWAYYTNWYLGTVPGSRAVCVEPNASNLEVGRRNIALNGHTAEFINALVGEASNPGAPGLECLDMDALLDRIDSSPIEVLHMDVQGAELPFIRSMPRAVEAGLVRFVVAVIVMTMLVIVAVVRAGGYRVTRTDTATGRVSVVWRGSPRPQVGAGGQAIAIGAGRVVLTSRGGAARRAGTANGPIAAVATDGSRVAVFERGSRKARAGKSVKTVRTTAVRIAGRVR
jgi:hypothetical protein